MTVVAQKEPYFGLKGKWLTFWITVCASDVDLVYG